MTYDIGNHGSGLGYAQDMAGHENGIEINKKNLATNNAHFHKKRRERSLRS
jgi:hypothetical protein